MRFSGFKLLNENYFLLYFKIDNTNLVLNCAAAGL